VWDAQRGFKVCFGGSNLLGVKRRRGFVALCLGLLVGFGSGSARADEEGWLIFDSRLPVHSRSQTENRHRVSVRLMGDFRVAGRAHGLQQALMRLGMSWEPWPFLLLGSQTNANVQTSDGTKYVREWRQELEATLGLPLAGPLWLEHRQRLEFRHQEGVGFSPRHRILLRLNLKLRGSLWPTLFDEVMVTSGPDWLNQNRLSVGVVWRARKNLIIEAGYMWRLRNVGAGGLVGDHAPRIALSFLPSSVESSRQNFFASD
jgi:hypothetical protein